MLRKNFSIDEIKMLIEATYRIIDAGKRADDPNNINTEIQFLALFIQTLVSRTLNIKGVDFETMKNNFNTVKLCVQEAAATAFQESMQEHAKQPIEYYCLIRPVPTTTNRTTH